MGGIWRYNSILVTGRADKDEITTPLQATFMADV
jgi:hypothetical protein